MEYLTADHLKGFNNYKVIENFTYYVFFKQFYLFEKK